MSKSVDNVFFATGFISLQNRALRFLLPRRNICIDLWVLRFPPPAGVKLSSAKERFVPEFLSITVLISLAGLAQTIT